MNRYFIHPLLAGILLFTSTGNATECKNRFFSQPTMISPNDLLDRLDSASLDMRWQFGPDDFFRFVTGKDEVYFEIMFGSLPDSYEKELKNRFIEKPILSEGIEKDRYIFSYACKKGEQAVINQLREEKCNADANHSSYLVDERRIIENSVPRQIDEEEILSIICNCNVLFYTGAGLSVDSGIPSMAGLYDLLGLEEGEKFADSLKNASEYPEEFAEKIQAFHDACFFSPPTEAHLALKKLAIFKNTKIITENLDLLHEHSGIAPYRIHAEEVREIGIASLSRIDYVICLGVVPKTQLRR